MVKLTGRRTRSLKLANGITHAVTRSIKAVASAPSSKRHR